jgi:DNA polymerase-3 subunit delta
MFYLLYGTDEFSSREELARLRSQSETTFGEDSFSGAETPLSTIIEACNTLPLLGGRFVTVIGLPKVRRGGETAASETPAPKPRREKKKGSATSRQAFIAGLAAYVPQLPPATTLVVLVDEALEAASPLVQAARRHGQARSFAPPRGADLERWIVARFRQLDCAVRPDAVRYLTAFATGDMRRLANEIAKLATYAGPQGAVGMEELRQLTPLAQQVRAFDLTDALARRERQQALRILHELLDAGDAPLQLIGMIAFQTRTLILVKELAERGLRAPQIAQEAGISPFVVDKALAQVRRFSFAQLEAAHHTLVQTDAALKRSRLNPELALDLLVLAFGDTTPAAIPGHPI